MRFLFLQKNNLVGFFLVYDNHRVPFILLDLKKQIIVVVVETSSNFFRMSFFFVSVMKFSCY